MGIEKIGTNIGKEIIAWTRTGGKGLLATRPVKINTQGLKYVPALEKDVVQLSKNDCLANIKKLGLNEEDSKLLENLLSNSEYPEELQKSFNRVINRPDMNLDELRKLYTGGVAEEFLGRKIYRNDILHYDYRFKATLSRLRTMQPNDLEIIKHCSLQELEIFNFTNDLNEFILPDKYIKRLSYILKEDSISIQRAYSDKLNRYIIECSGKDRTYFKFDPKTKLLEFLEENGNKKIKILRYKNGNERIIKLNLNNENTGELIKETIYLKDAKGNPTRLITYEKSDVDGFFNVIQKDLKTGKKVPLSEAFVDSTGKKIVRQNLVSQRGTKSQINYEELPNGNSQYRYTITDKKGNTLLDQLRSREALNDSEFVYKINGNSYNVKFTDSNKIEILNQQTKQIDTIDLKTLLSELSDNEKAEMINMLKKVPADELLAINKYGIDQLLFGSANSSSDLLHSGSIVSLPNEFVFLHELGHQKDSGISTLCQKEKELLKKVHREFKNMMDDIDNWHPDIDDSIDALTLMRKLEKKTKNQISTNKELLKIYKKEKAAYIKKFGKDDERINYFIRSGSGLGAEGEAVAEINALLSTPISQSMLGTRSYLLAENFPETIAYASKLLF